MQIFLLWYRKNMVFFYTDHKYFQYLHTCEINGKNCYTSIYVRKVYLYLLFSNWFMILKACRYFDMIFVSQRFLGTIHSVWLVYVFFDHVFFACLISNDLVQDLWFLSVFVSERKVCPVLWYNWSSRILLT